MYDLKETRTYSKIKEEALDPPRRKICFRIDLLYDGLISGYIIQVCSTSRMANTGLLW